MHCVMYFMYFIIVFIISYEITLFSLIMTISSQTFLVNEIATEMPQMMITYPLSLLSYCVSAPFKQGYFHLHLPAVCSACAPTSQILFPPLSFLGS